MLLISVQLLSDEDNNCRYVDIPSSCLDGVSILMSSPSTSPKSNWLLCFHLNTTSFPPRPPAPRHGYHGSSGSSAPVKALADLKLHLTNSSHPASSSSSSSDMVVIHPGAVLAMLDLLPSVSSDSQPEVRKCQQEMCSGALPVLVGHWGYRQKSTGPEADLCLCRSLRVSHLHGLMYIHQVYTVFLESQPFVMSQRHWRLEMKTISVFDLKENKKLLNKRPSRSSFLPSMPWTCSWRWPTSCSSW